jgi:hypothetical protein
MEAERQGVEVKPHCAHADKFAITKAMAGGADSSRWPGLELSGEAGRTRENGPAGVVNGDPFQIFPLAEPFDRLLDASFGRWIEQRFNGIPKAGAENFRAIREIAAEDPSLGIHLIRGKEQAARGHAHNQRDHHFQSGAHRNP